MTSPIQTPFLELQRQLWKIRGQAKQQWLEQSLAQPIKDSYHAAWRLTWIKQALTMVKRGQVEIKHHKALMDAYMEHLGVLEVMLIAAAEQKHSTEEAANLSVEAGAVSAENMITARRATRPSVTSPANANMRELVTLSPARE
jgi:hypothetical protein